MVCFYEIRDSYASECYDCSVLGVRLCSLVDGYHPSYNTWHHIPEDVSLLLIFIGESVKVLYYFDSYWSTYCDVHAVGQQSTVETLVYNRC
jgi:hypothetical protein